MAHQNSTTSIRLKFGIHSTQEMEIFLYEDESTKHSRGDV